MIEVATVQEVRAAARAARRGGGSVGLVPTMGYLHDGHLSLMRAARDENDFVIATIFVNPLQFDEGEDLSTYPRDLDGDRSAARTAGVDLLFTPDDDEMYPEPVLTTVTVARLSEHMEGATRPTHFDGVATVVAKLFSIVGPCRAYFGEKDFQQLAVVSKMARDLSLPATVVGCPIVRDDDGLALSSRNAYLTAGQRAAAPVLRRALDAGIAAARDGVEDAAAVVGIVTDVIESEPEADLDYVALVDAATLEPVDRVAPGRELRLITAARFGIPRLLDNCALHV